jgi:hydroxymethylglutaryl-CoA reductase (NADPH)
MEKIQIPSKITGPIKINFNGKTEEVKTPLATYETPLWPSVNRGAKISRLTSGITLSVLDDRMTRSVILETENTTQAITLKQELIKRFYELEEIVKTTSSHALLIDIQFQIIANLIYIRFAFKTGDASGHNMTTKASDALINWITKEYPYTNYVSISGNICTDKKVSSINSILGRGKNVTAEITISKEICEKHLRTTPEKIVALNTKKNLIGSILAGSTRSANAHYANILLAFYLATGQDAANIVEGSQGITYASIKNKNLYFSINCPNLIVGTIGNGKDHSFVKENLKLMDCLGKKPSGENSKRLAAIITAAVLCSELSLLAAQTNPGELIKSHIKLERKKK